MAVVVVLFVTAIVGPAIIPHDPSHQYRLAEGGLDASGDPVGPGGRFLLGTDLLGRDELSRLVAGSQTSLTVALLATAVAAVIGTVVGGVAAFAGNPSWTFRWAGLRVSVRMPVETVLMRFTDVVLSLPALLVAFALAAVVHPSQWTAAAVIAAILWTGTARIVYGRVLDVKRQDFITAAEAVGVSPLRILIRHVWPHVSPLVVVYATLGISAAVLFEATLSYLGAGAQPPTASWGSMVSEHRNFFTSQPRLVLLPGMAILITVLGFNLLGDAFRDALDPRHVREPGRAKRPVEAVPVGAHPD